MYSPHPYFILQKTAALRSKGASKNHLDDHAAAETPAITPTPSS